MVLALAATIAAGCQKQETATAPVEPAAAIAADAPADAAAPREQRVVSILLMVDENDVAVNGYDPVSYFSGAPAPGDPAITSIVDGAEYRFASVENKAAFDADPAAYQPQYGGYCAYGAAQGGKYRTDPSTGTVVNGKLYFNKDKAVQRLWSEKRDELIATADAAWPGIAYDGPQD
jgi:YHS domain-containing protein